MALQLVSEADLRCVLHHDSGLTRLQRSLGPSLDGKRPKTEIEILILGLVTSLAPNPINHGFGDDYVAHTGSTATTGGVGAAAHQPVGLGWGSWAPKQRSWL